MTEAELAAHHAAARNASVADWLTLGKEQGKEDALACVRICDDRTAAWLDAHTAAFVKPQKVHICLR
jgi:hypothetical protein